MFPSLMHIVRISPCYFLNWRLPGVSEAIYQCGSVCYLHILVIIQYCQFATKADYSGPGSPARASQQPPVLHLSARGPQLSLFSLPRPEPGQLREAQHQGRGREPGGRAARPSSTYEMLSSGQRSGSSHQARLQPLLR